MPTCVIHEYPPGEIFCRNCGRRKPSEEHPDPSDGELERLKKEIQSLKQDLVRRKEEIDKLNEEIKTVTSERDELVEKHPKLEPLIRQLDEKDRALLDAQRQLEELRKLLPVLPPPPPGSKSQLVIEAHPIPNSSFELAFTDQHNSLDLFLTPFHIRADLERNPDGSVGLAIRPGATINVKALGETRWRKVNGGDRLKAEAGMILFDTQGAMNARLDRRD